MPCSQQYFANGILHHNSGKTFVICRAIMIRALKAPGSRHVVLRHRMNAVVRSIWLDTMPKVRSLCFPEVRLKPHTQDRYWTLPNGAEIWVGGLDDKERIEKILGAEYVTIYLNECSQIAYSSVLVARTRLAQKVPNLTARAFYDLNPVGKGHWSNKLFGNHIDPASLKPIADPALYARMFLNPRDNQENLTPEFIADLDALPDRQRKRFFLGEYVDEIDGALWTIEVIDSNRVDVDEKTGKPIEALPPFIRVVVAVDPSGTSGNEDTRSDAVGIVVAGLGNDGICYVLEDATCQLPPAGWGYRAWEMADKHGADCIVAEGNFGGEMVRYVLESTEPQAKANQIRLAAKFKMVTASRGKAIRAEPVSALYDKGKVRHVGRFPLLEDQMLSFSTAGYLGERSPDRADALVWALTELAVGTGTPVFDTPVSQLMVAPLRRAG